MEFLSFIGDIKKYFENNLPKVLEVKEEKYSITLPLPNNYIEGYVDLDKYKNKIVFYILSNSDFDFEELSNESKAMKNEVYIFITFTGDKESVLEKLGKIYLEALYDLVKSDESLGNTVDYAFISQMKFYDGVEGSSSGKAISLRLQVIKEV